MATSSNSAEPLAIVGLSFKLPQDAVDETSFWEVMEKRKNLSTDWPTDRTCLDGFYQDGPKEPNMVCYCPEIKSSPHQCNDTDSMIAPRQRNPCRQPRSGCL
jgi:hypothetical protein